MTVRFSVTLPPSVNNLYPTVRGRRIKSRAYKSWLDRAGWDIVEQLGHRPHVGGRVEVRLLVGVDHRSDIDGRCKAMLDLLVTMGIIDDDCWVERLTIERAGMMGKIGVGIAAIV